MKKTFMALALVLALLAGCASPGTSKPAETTSQETTGQETTVQETSITGPATDKTFVIGISQLVEHPALDDARRGFEEGLKELGVNAEIQYQNAQGEIPNAATIAQKFTSDGVDLIFAIATPAAQSAQQVTTEIPIVFSAVTDAVEAGLVKSNENSENNITGTSDAAPMDRQLALFKALNPEAKTIGILYSTSEANSMIQVETAKEIGKGLGLEIVEVGISTLNDLPQAADSLVKKVDGIYTLTDNTVATSVNVVAEKAIEAGLITVAAEDAHVKSGILVTDGLSYYELGRQSAVMAKSILVDGKKPAELPVEHAKNTTKVYNAQTLSGLGLDVGNQAFEGAKPIE